MALSIGTFSVSQQMERRKGAHQPEVSLQALTEASVSISADQGATLAATPDALHRAGVMTYSTRPIAQPAVSLTQLPSEATLLQRGMLDHNRIGGALERENFAGTVDAFEADPRTDSLATQMTNAYRTTIEAALAKISAGVLEHFSCGLNPCRLLTLPGWSETAGGLFGTTKRWKAPFHFLCSQPGQCRTRPGRWRNTFNFFDQPGQQRLLCRCSPLSAVRVNR